MAKATSKSASSRSPPKTKSTERGKEASINLPADVPAVPRRVTYKVANIPPLLSETEMKLLELEFRLSKQKLQLKKLQEKTDVEDELELDRGPEVEDQRYRSLESGHRQASHLEIGPCSS